MRSHAIRHISSRLMIAFQCVPSSRSVGSELSAQRALTVTRALIDEGMPRAQVFAAAFGAEQPVASNTDEKGRALNRRVEMAPVPRSANPQSAASPSAPTQAARP